MFDETHPFIAALAQAQRDFLRHYLTALAQADDDRRLLRQINWEAGEYHSRSWRLSQSERIRAILAHRRATALAA